MSIFNYEIIINGVKHDNNLEEELKIDRSDLDGEFEKYAKKYAYYGTLAEMASGREDKLKYQLELLYAHLDAEKRGEAQEMMAQNPKFKYTEAVYENLVKGDKRYQVAMLEYLDAKELAGKLMVAARAFEKKLESLKRFDRVDMGMSADTRVYNEQIRQTIIGNK